MFVIPCKYVKNSPIRECVKSIVKHHPEEKILVIDSFSQDDSYLEELSEIPQVIVHPEKNNQYPVGAWLKAVKSYPDEDVYVLVHDSFYLNSSLDEFFNGDGEAYTFQYFWDRISASSYLPGFIDYFNNILSNTKYRKPSLDEKIYGVQMHLNLMKNSLVKRVLASGLFDDDHFYLDNKIHDNVWERLLGIILTQEGFCPSEYNLTGMNKNTGLHELDTKYFTKICLDRQ